MAAREARDDGAYRCLWEDTADPPTPLPSLQGDAHCDVAIIGGGFTGLSTAWHLKQASPDLEVVVLEAEEIGYGASGRNGGFSMTLFGLEPEVTRLIYGPQRFAQAHAYMCEAVDYVAGLTRELGFDSDYRHPGFIRVALTRRHEARLRKQYELYAEHGGEGDYEWLDAERMREYIRSPIFHGGFRERRCGLIQPLEQVREWRRVCLEAGVRIHERSPVERIERGPGGFALTTPEGELRADRLVLATNAYSHLLGGLRGIRSRQAPSWTYQIATEPLTQEQWQDLGWTGGEGIETNRQLVHYFRPTPDGRITFGGADIGLAFGGSMSADANPAVWRMLERHFRRMFPGLADVGISHRWGGPVSVTLDMAPAIGFLGDRRAVYHLGCMGHGVSLTQYGGRTISELLLGRESERTRQWFVDRRVLPWPPEPFRYLAGRATRRLLRMDDARLERGLWRRAGSGE